MLPLLNTLINKPINSLVVVVFLLLYYFIVVVVNLYMYSVDGCRLTIIILPCVIKIIQKIKVPRGKKHLNSLRLQIVYNNQFFETINCIMR